MAGLLQPDRREDNRPWGLILAICLAGMIGAVGLPLQFATYNLANTASKADVERNNEFLRRLAAIQDAQSKDVEDHRVANSAAHAEQCRIITDIARAAGIVIAPCMFEPYVPPTPTPTPAPSPTP